MCTYIHIYIYTYRYRYIHIYMYTYIHVCKAFLRIYLYVCSRVCARACVRARAAKELHKVVTTSRLIYINYISTFIHLCHIIHLD